MKTFQKEALAALEKQYRTNLINALAGIRPANLIGSISKNNTTNLAIFNSVMHIGADPALMGFIMRPTHVNRDTFINIETTQEFTINHVHATTIAAAHQTSARYLVSEFEACGFTPEYSTLIKAPYVAESVIQIGLKLAEIIPIQSNQTKLIIGEVQEIRIKNEDCITSSYGINLSIANSIGVNGLDNYYTLNNEATFKYAKPDQKPQQI